ncbi:MAG: hypothetical protein IJ151_01650 [Bacteroidales bacterium]|nr:hypothetical protein [Bacteroidales bacterium]
MKHIYYILFVLALFVQCSKSKQEVTEPALSSVSEDIGYYSATIAASFTYADRILSAGLYLTASAEETKKITGSLENGVVTCNLTGLQANTQYNYEVFYTNGKEERKLAKRVFRTKDIPCDEALWRWALGKFDADGDGDLSQAEREAVTNMNLSEDRVAIESCAGLELFPNVTLFWFTSPLIKTVDLSPLKKLDNAHISGDNIESIGFDNPLLKKFRADGTKISNLNFAGAPALENIEVYGVPFKEIHFENNPRMDTFVLTGSEAEVIDMSMCPLMYRIDFGEDPGTVPFLKKLILPKNTVFEVLKVPSSVAIEYK